MARLQQLYKAIPSDANLDGAVDVLGDAFALIGNLGATGNTTWSQGDFNGDGQVDVLGDAFVLIANLGQSAIPPTASQAKISLAATSDDASESLQRDVAFATDFAWDESDKQRKKRLANIRTSELEKELSLDDVDSVFQLS